MEKKKTSLSDRRYLVPFVLITSLFFMWGFARAILDVLNKHFQNELDINIAQSALIQVMTYLGYFIMAIPAGLFINRYGYRKGVIACSPSARCSSYRARLRGRSTPFLPRCL